MNEVIFPEGYKYGKGWIVIFHELGSVAPSLEIDGETLLPKDRFHMSIFCVKKYAPLIAQQTGESEAEVEEQILEEAKRLIETKRVTVKGLREEFRLAEEDEKKTVVVMCDANGLEEFFEGMRKTFSIDIPLQPTHLTLYTRDGGVGIGLTGNEDVEKLTRLLTTEESEAVKKAINWQDRT
ncbi:MAG TPA: hypothetical protein VLE93_01690 [Candidatus Saccharimonadales bacterium]|nr:hypothetical protein [Candidatus Saccharimonadales bacterium]